MKDSFFVDRNETCSLNTRCGPLSLDLLKLEKNARNLTTEVNEKLGKSQFEPPAGSTVDKQAAEEVDMKSWWV